MWCLCFVRAFFRPTSTQRHQMPTASLGLVPFAGLWWCRIQLHYVYKYIILNLKCWKQKLHDTRLNHIEMWFSRVSCNFWVSGTTICMVMRCLCWVRGCMLLAAWEAPKQHGIGLLESGGEGTGHITLYSHNYTTFIRTTGQCRPTSYLSYLWTKGKSASLGSTLFLP